MVGEDLNLSIPLEESFLIALDTAVAISRFDNLENFSNTNEYVDEFEYNLRNSILKPFTKYLDLLVNYMRDESIDDHTNFVIVILFMCGLYFFTLVLLSITAILSEKIIKSEAKLCLCVPAKKCRKKKDLAIEFYEAWISEHGEKNDGEAEGGNNEANRYSTLLNQQNQRENSKRNFSEGGIFSKSFLMKLLCTIILVFAFIAGMGFGGEDHYSKLMKIANSFNNSARLDQHLLFLDNTFIVNLVQNDTIVEGMSTLQALNSFILKSEYIVNKFQIEAREMIDPFSEEFKASLIDFLYYSM